MITPNKLVFMSFNTGMIKCYLQWPPQQKDEDNVVKLLKSFLVCLFLILGMPSIATGAPLSQPTPPIFFVKETLTGSADCTSWDDACGLQAALDKAIPGDEIWVAAGTYLPTKPISSTFPKNSPTFNLETGVAIYGGFPAEGGEWRDRDPAFHLTTLSGELGLASDDTDNSFHVVTASGVDATAILDGFTISGGRASGSVGGGGMYNRGGSSPTLTKLIFSGNFAGIGGGGGIFNEGGSPRLTDVTFTNNFGYFGGGMFNTSGSPILNNVSFIGNETDMYGGGMINVSSHPKLTNVTFSANMATRYGGGGMANFSGSNPELTNVTFTGNQASIGFLGGAILNVRAGHTMTSTIVWGNTPVVNQIYNYDETAFAFASYSIIEGGYAGETNISSDPLLSPLADNGGLTHTHALGAGSPAIDNGNPVNCPATDQRGFLRSIDGDGDGTAVCDMGAYEVGNTLAVDVLGHGIVAIIPEKSDYQPGETVTIDASAEPDWAFNGWSGDATGATNPLTITISGHTSITANFKQIHFRYMLFPIYK